MATHQSEIAHYFSELLAVERFDDLCFNGLQFEGTRPIRKVATAVTASFSAIEKACKLNADMLLVHHGLFLKGALSDVRGTLRKKIALLIESGMHLFAYHLPLDAHVEFGNAWPIARKLGWQNLKPFGSYKGMTLGVQGSFAPISIEQLQSDLARIWECGGVVVKPSGKLVSSAALVTGSGHRCFPEAIALGLDCLITGTSDEPIWHMAHEENVHFLAFGHAATEATGVKLLGSHLEEKYGVSHQFIPELNPF